VPGEEEFKYVAALTVDCGFQLSTISVIISSTTLPQWVAGKE
jgi:hypothetical protein